MKTKTRKEEFMRGKIAVLTILGFVLSLGAFFTLARAEEQQSEAYVIWEIVVKPSKILQYEEAVKEEIATYNKQNWPYASFAYSTLDYCYYFLTPVKSFADLDAIKKDWLKILDKLGKEKYQEFWNRKAKTIEYYKYGIIHRSPELSHAPESLELRLEEANYIYWGLCHVKPGKEQAFEENFKKLVELYSSKGVTQYGWITFVGDMGTDMPFYFNAIPAKSAVDYWTRKKKGHAKVGVEQLSKIWTKGVLPNIRKYEPKLGRARPDLSCVPKEK